MRTHDGELKRFRETRYPHQRSEGTRGHRGWAERARAGDLPAKDLTGLVHWTQESTKENR